MRETTKERMFRSLVLKSRAEDSSNFDAIGPTRHPNCPGNALPIKLVPTLGDGTLHLFGTAVRMNSLAWYVVLE
jgi:hypothetical protein